jgi:hypothetical protein
MEPWMIAIAISIVSGLIAIIYWAGQSRDDKQDARFDKDERTMMDHIKDDVAAHERIKALEIKVETHDREIASIRERWHDLRSEISTTLGNWYVNLVKMIGKQ